MKCRRNDEAAFITYLLVAFACLIFIIAATMTWFSRGELKQVVRVEKEVYEYYIHGIPPWDYQEELAKGSPSPTAFGTYYRVIADDNTYAVSHDEPKGDEFRSREWYKVTQ